MKNLKLLCVFTAMAICLCAFSACSPDSSPVALSCGTSKITANMYNFWASTSKSNLVSSYADMTDTDEFWASDYKDGKTYAQYFDDIILEDVKMLLVAMKLFNDYGLTLPDDTKNSINENINDLVREYASGNKNALNQKLAEYGANTDILYSVRLQEAKRSALYSYLYGQNGKNQLSDDQKEAFYKENYVHFQLIYINNKYEYVLDSDGNYTTDEDGKYVTQKLSAEDAAIKDASISKVKEALALGADFTELYTEYSELKSYPVGYYYSRAETYNSDIFYTLVDKVSEVENGEIAFCESDYGTYIMQRLELDEGAWTGNVNSDFFSSFATVAANAEYREMLRTHFNEIEINTDAIKEYSIARVKQNYYF